MAYQPLGPPPHKSPYYVVNFDLRRQKGHGKKTFFFAHLVLRMFQSFKKDQFQVDFVPPGQTYEVEAQGVDMP